MNPPPDDIDDFREDNPAHLAQTLAEILNWDPESMLFPQPDPKGVQCASCHQEFKAEAQQFNGKWVYPTLCSVDCGDVKEDIRSRCLPARTRSYACPRCGIYKNVAPVLSGAEWHYFGQCSHCGYSWANAYHLILECPSCRKRNPITGRNPQGRCKCDGGGVSRPF